MTCIESTGKLYGVLTEEMADVHLNGKIILAVFELDLNCVGNGNTIVYLLIDHGYMQTLNNLKILTNRLAKFRLNT